MTRSVMGHEIVQIIEDLYVDFVERGVQKERSLIICFHVCPFPDKCPPNVPPYIYIYYEKHQFWKNVG